MIVQRHGTALYYDEDGFVETPHVYRPLMKDRVYEEAFLEHIRSLDRHGVYVDIGAHLGTHTVWFAALCPSTKVHAFEPVGRFADVARRNIAANQVGDRVILHQVGLSDKPGHATNRLSPDHQTGFVADPTWAVESFDIVRLDDVLPRRERVVVMKLDVEGMEAAALRGSRRVLSKWRPVLYAEAHHKEAVAEIERVLRPFGYRATGKVFNSTPTYEFSAPERRGLERLRPAWRRMPARWRQRLRRVARRIRGARR